MMPHSIQGRCKPLSIPVCPQRHVVAEALNSRPDKLRPAANGFDTRVDPKRSLIAGTIFLCAFFTIVIVLLTKDKVVEALTVAFRHFGHGGTPEPHHCQSINLRKVQLHCALIL